MVAKATRISLSSAQSPLAPLGLEAAGRRTKKLIDAAARVGLEAGVELPKVCGVAHGEHCRGATLEVVTPSGSWP